MKLAALLIVAALAAVAPQAASLPDIEDEVMCVECGTVLSVSSSPVAQQERAFIREQIAAGKDKDEIKAALVAEYGEDVLAVPDGDSIYLVPIAALVLAAVGIGFALRRWRRNAGSEPETELPPPLSPEDARRLDAELGT
jgi:cytochrome c-type biogenesis protein CcmH/NrfF